MEDSASSISKWFGLLPPRKFCDDKCYFIPGMANSTVFETNKGLVIFDLPTKQNAMKTFQAIRKFTTKPVKYLIYSHGHFDHAYGSEPFIKEIKEKKWEIPEIIAHENCIRRFEKYKLLDKYHEWINRQQFASVIRDTTNQTVDPNKALYPTIILRGNESNYFFTLDGLEFELYHDKGETDDSIWLWVPEKEIICSGDLILSSFPNIGNPYKVQRYPKDWAIALDKMLEKGAKYLAPGHGQLIEGKENVEDALSITAEALHFVHDEIVKRLNEGKWFEDIYHEMLEIFPEKFRKHPMLKPIYGCYRFAIHATYRLYHGWYDSGNPTDLFPARKKDVAREFLIIANESKYLSRARLLFEEGKLQLALHVLDILILGEEEVSRETLIEALQLKFKILKKKVKQEPSFIAKNIINNAANQIKEKLKIIKK